MKQTLIHFYNAYIATGSNITSHANAHGITPTDCYLMVQMGEKYSKQ